ncbi:MAG: hypothetical protein E6J80_13200 [Deltaproteobacteria bacterium]|nr:MAG: hypothetical protein E6J80_13200 [Deltaproteobacteria bacterium]
MPSDSWIRLALPVLLSVAASVLVNWWLGPMFHVRQEQARRDLAARREVMRAVETLRVRLRIEGVSRDFRNRATPEAAPPALTIEEFDRLSWPITHALENPDLNRNSANGTRARLASLVGDWYVDFQETRTEAGVSQTDANRRTHMSYVASQTHPEVTNLRAKMFADQSDEVVVADLIRGLDEIARVLGG